jgi:hypothetical protein
MEISVLSLSFVQIKLSIFALLFSHSQPTGSPSLKRIFDFKQLNTASQFHDSNVLLVLCIRRVVVSYAASHKVL